MIFLGRATPRALGKSRAEARGGFARGLPGRLRGRSSLLRAFFVQTATPRRRVRAGFQGPRIGPFTRCLQVSTGEEGAPALLAAEGAPGRTGKPAGPIQGRAFDRRTLGRTLQAGLGNRPSRGGRPDYPPRRFAQRARPARRGGPGGPGRFGRRSWFALAPASHVGPPSFPRPGRGAELPNNVGPGPGREAGLEALRGPGNHRQAGTEGAGPGVQGTPRSCAAVFFAALEKRGPRRPMDRFAAPLTAPYGGQYTSPEGTASMPRAVPSSRAALGPRAWSGTPAFSRRGWDELPARDYWRAPRDRRLYRGAAGG